VKYEIGGACSTHGRDEKYVHTLAGIATRLRAENFSLQHRVQNGSGPHPDSYPGSTGNSLPEGKAAEA
jgi:hypothetical protein